jgi:hypothetical protein
MLANDDPAAFLREHGWQLEPHGWQLVRSDGVFCLIDLDTDAPRSLYEPCLAGTLDVGMNPVEFPTVEGAVRWIERHTAQELRARADVGVGRWETR